MSTKDAPHGRGMAWATLLVSAAISLGVNLWHAFDRAPGGHVTWWFASLATLYGTAPVVLAAFQSHSAAFVPMGRAKRALTYVLVLLGMVLSVQAQAASVAVFAGPYLKWIFPLLVDLSAFMALHTLMESARARTAPVRTEVVSPSRTALPVICERKIGMPYVRAPRPVLRSVRETYAADGTGERAGTGESRTAVRTGGDSARTGRRTGAVPAERTGRTAQVSAPVRDVREGRAHWVRVLAEEIRTARAEGRTWEPVYAELEARTGWGRSWNEKTVRAAREAAEARTGGERTGTDA